MEYHGREKHQLVNIAKASSSFLQKRTKKLLIIFAIAVLVALILVQHSKAATKDLFYEPAKVQLSGTVIIQQFYGPPNFGENPTTDKKVDAFLLKLDAPVDVNPQTPLPQHHCDDQRACADAFLDSDSYENVQRMELVDLDYPTQHLDKFIGKHVAVNGKLYERDNGNQYTDVLIIVDSIIGIRQ